MSRVRPPAGIATFLTAGRREADLDALAGGLSVDVLVVGGGVTGAGAALDAASRGLSVALLERRDLATGTSRWSSKLVHGGLRYLAQGRVGLAWESARERATLTKVTAPHLVRALPFLTPMRGRRVSPPPALATEAGVRFGDAMRALAGTSRRRLPSVRRISAAEATLWAPALAAQGLRGALLHWDGQLEDDARLVVALARTAAAHGARIVTHAQALELHGDGARALDVRGGTSFDVRARHVVNATGVWAGGLVDGIALRPSRGSHLLVDSGRLGTPRAALNVPVPGAFGRFVFAVPRSDGLVMVGLTDEPVSDGAVPDAPEVTREEEAFLLDTLSVALERRLCCDDVVGRFAGLRPLAAGEGATADLSREHQVIEDPRTGVITVVGGKLTTYRRMAQDTVDRVAARPGVDAGPCRTAHLPLVGAPAGPVPHTLPPRLLRRFGAEAVEVAALADDRPELLRPLAPGVPVLGVELLAARDREGALTLEDVLERRTRLGLVPAWREAAWEAAQRLLPELAEVAA
ncbi:MAG TPA: glycerol-3-phosphate dehydrogenase/oxidase [Solirubrobacteraceae bacterium]|nr:glycerol-3-phosphate dehydrogenase/oxidase [Solirubrobacteraceae bacterium]